MMLARRALKLVCSSVFAAALTACGGGGGGPGNDSNPTGLPGNHLPMAVVVVEGSDLSSVGDAVHVALGTKLAADASGSTDEDKDSLTFTWRIISQPTASKAAIDASGAKAAFTPDVLGDYVLSLEVNDGQGGVVVQERKLVVDNHLPISDIKIDPQAATPQAIRRAVTLGSTVALDASASTDPDGDLLNTAWKILKKPDDSRASLSKTSGDSSRLVPDALGIYIIQSVTSDAKGASGTTEVTLDVNNRPPQGVMAVTVPAGMSSLDMAQGYEVVLDGSTSTDPDGDGLSHAWDLLSKPASSQALITASTGKTLSFIPDVIGDYRIRMVVSDAKGAQGIHELTLKVTNRRPVASISSNATPVAQASAPTARVPVGTDILLRGSDSADADGDVLTHAWTVVSRPVGSLASLSATNTANVRLVPDLEGTYQFKLRVTDSKGAYSERDLEVIVGGQTPVAILDQTRVMAIVGEDIRLSAAASSNLDRQATTYAWSLDTKPQNSKADVSSITASVLSFKPDVEGTYVATVTVGNGKRTATASAVILAEKSWTGVLDLDLRPLDAVYNRAQEIVVLSAAASPALVVADPIGKKTTTIPLAKAVTTYAVSPDGRHAAVAHDGLLSYVDLLKGTVQKTITVTGVNASSIVLTDDGLAYLFGQHHGSAFTSKPVVSIDMNSGAKLDDGPLFPGQVSGILASRMNQIFLYDADFSGGADKKTGAVKYLTFDPVTHAFTQGGSLFYADNQDAGSQLWLSEDQATLFTSNGTMFNTATGDYAGAVPDLVGILSFSQARRNGIDEVLYTKAGPDINGTRTLLPRYGRLTGYLGQAEEVALPAVHGQPSYAVKVFHSAQGRPVALVQTGSNLQGGAGLSYHLVYP